MESDLRRLALESEENLRLAEMNHSEAALAMNRIKELEIAQQEVRERIAECSRLIQETGLLLDEQQRELAGHGTHIDHHAGAPGAHMRRGQLHHAEGGEEIQFPQAASLVRPCNPGRWATPPRGALTALARRRPDTDRRPRPQYRC